jgi:hypothetical protein
VGESVAIFPKGILQLSFIVEKGKGKSRGNGMGMVEMGKEEW